MTAMPNPKPLLLVLLAGGALWLITRRANATPTSSRLFTVPSSGQLYATPTMTGERIARSVVGLIQGFLPGATAVDKAADARAAVRANDPYYRDGDLWAGPIPDYVDRRIAVGAYGAPVDSIAAGPVYDPTTDYVRAQGGWGIE